jgi:hypothetical protein
MREKLFRDVAFWGRLPGRETSSRLISLIDAISGSPSAAIAELEDAGGHRQKKRSAPWKKSAWFTFDLFYPAGENSPH